MIKNIIKNIFLFTISPYNIYSGTYTSWYGFTINSISYIRMTFSVLPLTVSKKFMAILKRKSYNFRYVR